MLLVLAQYSGSSSGGEEAVVLIGAAACWGCMCLFGLVYAVLWVWALIDCLMGDFDGNEKILWIVLLIFLPGIAVILYFFIGRSKKRNYRRVQQPPNFLDDSRPPR